MIITFGRVVSLVISIGIFVGFTMLVGAVSETETIIGLILAGIAGLSACRLFNCY